MDHRGNEAEAGYVDFTEIATPGSSPASGKLRVYPKSDDSLYTQNSAGVETKVGALQPWSLAINESGASFANWTAGAGTWSSDGTNIIQTDSSAAGHYAYFTAQVATTWRFVFQLDMFVVSGGSTTTLGVTLSLTGNSSTRLFTEICGDATHVATMRVGEVGVSQTDNTGLFSVNHGNWFTYTGSVFTDLGSGNSYIEGWINRNYIAAVRNAVGDPVSQPNFGLSTFGASVKYRNIKVMTIGPF
jgi:hypothetical protein